jgi:hypothetical protein
MLRLKVIPQFLKTALYKKSTIFKPWGPNFMISFSIFWNFLRLLEDECRENVGTYVGTYQKQPEVIWLSINDLNVNVCGPDRTQTIEIR